MIKLYLGALYKEIEAIEGGLQKCLPRRGTTLKKMGRKLVITSLVYISLVLEEDVAHLANKLQEKVVEMAC